MDIVEGKPLARSEDKHRRVCRKLIHHHAYRTKPHLTYFKDISYVTQHEACPVRTKIDLSLSLFHPDPIWSREVPCPTPFIFAMQLSRPPSVVTAGIATKPSEYWFPFASLPR
jgi:hypothetical protein